MTGRAVHIEGAAAIAGVETLPARHPRTGILVGLPGGDVYLRRDVEQGLIAERRLHDLATVRAIKLGEYIRDRQAVRFRLTRVTPDIEAAKEQLRRERARASGLTVPEIHAEQRAVNALLDPRQALEALRKLRKDPRR